MPDTIAAIDRRELMLAGFYGRGNCGDEAMLQCLYEAFANEYQVSIGLDRFGAHQDHAEWYPYAETRCFHQGWNGEISDRAAPAGLIIGGGDLPIGFCANLVAAAQAFEVPAVLAGVDLADNWLLAHKRNPHFVGEYLAQFRLVVVRTRDSMRVAQRIGIPALLGSDFALRLDRDTAPDVMPTPGRALVVVREFPPELTPGDYASAMRDIIAALAAHNLVPILLPFAPEDERFLAETGIAQLAPIERCWWNARRMKQVIAASGLLVSVGRLHPLIFALDPGTPAVAIEPPVRNEAGRIWKIEALCDEFDLPMFRTIAAFRDALPQFRCWRANPVRVAEASARLTAAIAAIRQVLEG